MTFIRPKAPEAGVPAAASREAAAAARREIAEEHRRLRLLVDRLEATGDLEVLASGLEQLGQLLEVHFVREESPGGLHRVVDTSAPHLAPAVQGLFEEHREVLTRLEGLVAEVRECLEGPVASVHREVAELCRRLREHEEAETELLAGALYDDIGGGD